MAGTKMSKSASIVIRFWQEDEEQATDRRPPQNRYIPLSKLALGYLLTLENPEYASMKAFQKETSTIFV